MGLVYEAMNLDLGRRVALKRLRPIDGHEAEMVARLHREARAAAAIRSDHVVDILDVVRDGQDELHIVMELLEGESLGRCLKRRGLLSIQESARIVLDVLAGLQAAHDRQVVHRDLKPENVFLHRKDDGTTVVKLLDFGISKVFDESAQADGKITATGALLGSPRYMSPEQARGLPNVDHRTDIYSAGVILYECLTGSTPHGKEPYPVHLAKLISSDPPHIRHYLPELSPVLADVVHTALAREPEERFTTVKAMREALLPHADVTAPLRLPRLRLVDEAEDQPPTPFAGESHSSRPDSDLPGFARARWLSAVGLTVAIVVGLGLWFGLGSTPTLPHAVPLAGRPLPAGPASPSPPTSSAAPAPSAPVPPILPAAPATTAATAADVRMMRIRVLPRGAHATIEMVGGQTSTRNPAELVVPPGVPSARIVVTAPGFRRKELEVDATRGELDVFLARSSEHGRGLRVDEDNPLRPGP
jgi:serine/threonine-protein kinase